MPWRKPIAGFLCRFVLIFALLAAPWPGWRAMDGHYLLSAARTVFSSESGPREVTFEAVRDHSRGEADARIAIVNRDLMAADGSGPVRNLDIALGNLGVQSTALLVALFCATPIPWKQRGFATLAGFLLLQVCLLGLLAFAIWSESAEVQLVNLSPALKEMSRGLELTFLSQFNIAVPVLTWIVVMLCGSSRIGSFPRIDAAK